MKTTLRIEEAAMFLFSIFLFVQTDFAWWWFPLLLLLPDIGMLGYIAGARIGALSYNIFHHKAIALTVYCLGWFISSEWTELAGIILFGHSCMDRIVGYGLKYTDAFKHTHLGWIGGVADSQRE